MSDVLLRATGLVKEYEQRGERVRVVDGVSVEIARGETLGLVGESGSGKSTVARMVLRLTEPTSGEIHFDNIDLMRASAHQMRMLRRRMQIVFQDPYGALNPRMRVREILAEPFSIHGWMDHREQGWRAQGSGPSRRAMVEQRLIAMLAEVGMDGDALGRYPHEFSGGQRQRINIARALALKPDLLVLDEPVSALDVSVGAQVINLLRELQGKYGLTYLFISHSMPLVRYLCDRVAVMRRGQLVETGTVDEVCERPREEYTQQLIAATPNIEASMIRG